MAEVEDTAKLIANYEFTWKNVRETRWAQGPEQKYSQAYQRLVRAGLRPQIRGKYR